MTQTAVRKATAPDRRRQPGRSPGGRAAPAPLRRLAPRSRDNASRPLKTLRIVEEQFGKRAGGLLPLDATDRQTARTLVRAVGSGLLARSPYGRALLSALRLYRFADEVFNDALPGGVYAPKNASRPSGFTKAGECFGSPPPTHQIVSTSASVAATFTGYANSCLGNQAASAAVPWGSAVTNAQLVVQGLLKTSDLPRYRHVLSYTRPAAGATSWLPGFRYADKPEPAYVPVSAISRAIRARDMVMPRPDGLPSRSNGTPRTRPVARPDVSIGVIVPPKGNPVTRPGEDHIFKPPPSGVRERKGKLGPSFAFIGNLIGQRRAEMAVAAFNAFTEGLDYLDAVFFSIPREFRGDAKTPQDKAAVIWEHYMQIDFNLLVQNLLVMEVSDRLTGTLSKGGSRLLRQYGNPSRGFQGFGLGL